MKKYLSIGMTALLVTVVFSSCKKETATPPAKDYTASIKDKTWWGTLTNYGETPQPYSAFFKSDNTVLWSQLSGDYTGAWSVANNKLTATFSSPAVVVTAVILDDNKLANITTSTPNKVNTGEILANPTIALDNTIWNGNVAYPLQSYPLPMTFLTNSKVQFKLSSNPSSTVPYTRSASGAFIRFYWGSSVFAGVIISGTEITGSYSDGSLHSWQANKQ